MRCSETGRGVPTVWANSPTRSSSIIQRTRMTGSSGAPVGGTAARRRECSSANAARDALWLATVEAVTEEYSRLRAAVPPTGAPDDPVARVRWMVEELRVGLFAQGIGTPRPISEQRVYKAIDALI